MCVHERTPVTEDAKIQIRDLESSQSGDAGAGADVDGPRLNRTYRLWAVAGHWSLVTGHSLVGTTKHVNWRLLTNLGYLTEPRDPVIPYVGLGPSHASERRPRPTMPRREGPMNADRGSKGIKLKAELTGGDSWTWT